LRIQAVISVVASIFLLTCCEKTANKTSGDAQDSAFKNKIDSLWAEVNNYHERLNEGKATKDENPQRRFAPELFQYYIKHPNTKTGKHALRSAFMMWGNVGDIEQVEKAIPQISVDSEEWSQILNGIGNAYWRNERGDDYIKLLHQLAPKLTNPKSQTELFYRLGNHYLEKDERKQATNYFEKIVSLQADSFYVEKAKGKLYELTSLNVGQIAPEFSVKDIKGNTITLSNLKDKIVLLDFWATWCGPCLPEIPYLKKIYAENRNKGLVMIGISLDENVSNLQKFIEGQNITWQQVLSEKKWEGALVKLYNVTAIPRTYVIDRQGKIASKNLRGDELRSSINALIK
jgi:peroxiredoxin